MHIFGTVKLLLSFTLAAKPNVFQGLALILHTGAGTNLHSHYMPPYHHVSGISHAQ